MSSFAVSAVCFQQAPSDNESYASSESSAEDAAGAEAVRQTRAAREVVEQAAAMAPSATIVITANMAPEEAAAAKAAAAAQDKVVAVRFGKALNVKLKALEASGGGPLKRLVEGGITGGLVSRPWSPEEADEYTNAMLEERRNEVFFFANVAKVKCT